jgi:DNA-binding NarL/FixJ family response regulator
VNKISIVVADDNEEMLSLCEEILQLEFEVVATVRDGRDLLQAVENFKPDVIIADISMPEISGIEATKRIITKNMGAKIILLTMHSNQRLVEEGISAGAMGYVFKMAAFRELVPAVHEVIQGRYYISPLMKKK